MYTLYGNQGSGSAAVEAAMALAGVPVRLVDAASWKAGPGLDALAQLNPLRQIPTVVLPDGQVLTESAAILMHLGLAHPGSGLLPEEPAARDRCLRGLVYIPANCYSCISILDYPQRYTRATDEAALDAIRAGTRETLHKHWEIFAELHPGTPFLTGAAPGALDLLAAVVSRWSGARKHLQSTRPTFAALLDRIDAHPAVAPVFARHWPQPVADAGGTPQA